MTLIQFTQNHADLSTDRGYQFKFFCDRCGNGYMSSFQPSYVGMTGGLLRAAGDLFGGALSRAGDSAHEIQRAVGGQAHDEALRAAVEEVKGSFRQCSRCGKWVCPEQCWNQDRGLCEDCAPDVAEERAAAEAQATRDQIWRKAGESDQQEGRKADRAVARCPSCNAKATSGKFCPECGTALATTTTCDACGAEIAPGAKFCPECGARQVQL